MSIEIAPIPTTRKLDIHPMAELHLPFDIIRQTLAQPHYDHDTDFPGNADQSRVMWRVQCRPSGVLLVLWDDRTDARTPADTSRWKVWWQDGGTADGRQTLELLLGDEVGGRIV